MPGLGKFLLLIGGIIFLAGLIVLAFGKSPFLGKLPGDFTWKGKNWSVYFPLATSILISGILSLIFYLINKFR
ncbi:MAG: DUF2905 domain-containing protein [Cytophagaceae bacterium]|nr:DUF2905 domain-containing protein [Cytophagaceae bacterium]